jgi:quercetin dioxygenase-like cupin family protein
MQIIRNGSDTKMGPSDWFTGTVYVNTVAVPSGRFRIGATIVHFTPGARSAWHSHPNGQTIFITEGMGLVQRRGGVIELVRPGHRVFFEPGEEHWHGATRNCFMTHLAMQEPDDRSNNATRGPKVSDEEYAAAPEVTGTFP